MRWQDVRVAYPDQWLVIEVLEARTVDRHRIFDRIAVMDSGDAGLDGRTAMRRCSELGRQHPDREFCFVHTSNAELDIEERRWIGIRGIAAADAPR